MLWLKNHKASKIRTVEMPKPHHPEREKVKGNKVRGARSSDKVVSKDKKPISRNTKKVRVTVRITAGVPNLKDRNITTVQS